MTASGGAHLQQLLLQQRRRDFLRKALVFFPAHLV